MTKKHSTKKALMASALSLVLCISMLVGTTFAWFTDSVTSANNIITSGNLDIELEYWNGTDWADVAGKSDILTNTLWEPGVTEVAYLRVANAGTLALKYQLGINIVSELEGKNAEGESFLLSDYIKFGVKAISVDTDKKPETYASREAAVAAVEALAADDLGAAKNISAGYNKFAPMVAGEELYLALVVYMPTTVGNEANHNGINIPQIDLGINVFATQMTAEEDSFGDDYDQDAWHPQMEVFTPDDLQTALNNGVTDIVLMDDMEINEPIVIPFTSVATTYSLRTPTAVVIDLNGKTLSANDSTYAFNNLGNLILKDSVGSGSVNARGIYNGYGQGGENVSSAHLRVDNVTINALGTNGGAAIYNYGIVEIKNSEFSSIGGYALNNQAGGKMTISNSKAKGGIYNLGELTVNKSTVFQHISGRHAIYNWSGSVVINGGQYDSTSGNELILADGAGASVVINGGTFDKTAKSWLFGAATGKNITFVINGGTFNGYVNLPENTVDTIRPYNDPIVVYGGTFNFNPTNWIVEGYNVKANSNGTYTVSRTPVSFSEFLSAVETANYNYDGTGALVVLKDSEYNWYNGIVRQYYIPKSSVNINSSLESLTVKNVTFVFEDDDTTNNHTAGELQTLAKNVTFENCTFENVSVSPWETKTAANDCASATFRNCTWKNLNGRYGVHQSKAATLTVTGCTFENCQRGIHVNTVANLTVKNNTFTGIGDGYGVLCLSEGITTALTAMDVSGNTAEGQTMLRQLSNAITYDQVRSIFANNTYGAGKEYVSGSIVL